MHNDAWPTDVTTPPEKSKNSKQRRYKNFVFIQLYFFVPYVQEHLDKKPFMILASKFYCVF